MYQVKLSNDRSHTVEKNKDGFVLNGQAFPWDIEKLSDGKYHIIHDSRSYRIEVVAADYEQKTFTLKINDQLIETSASSEIDLLLEKMGLNKQATKAVNELKAPMPGMVLEINISAGQSVKKGDKLLVLEAMKMENVLKSPTDATIKSLEVSQGVNVEKNQILVRFE